MDRRPQYPVYLPLAANDADLVPMLAKELVGPQPDVIVVHTTTANVALKRETCFSLGCCAQL
jgi:hypothetical protein